MDTVIVIHCFILMHSFNLRAEIEGGQLHHLLKSEVGAVEIRNKFTHESRPHKGLITIICILMEFDGMAHTLLPRPN
jgi:hypothetical protein